MVWVSLGLVTGAGAAQAQREREREEERGGWGPRAWGWEDGGAGEMLSSGFACRVGISLSTPSQLSLAHESIMAFLFPFFFPFFCFAPKSNMHYACRWPTCRVHVSKEKQDEARCGFFGKFN